MRASPTRTLAATVARDARIAAQVGVEVGRDRGPHLLEDRDALLVDRRRRPLVGGLGLAQRLDRALELLGQRRRVEVAQHRAGVVAGAAHEPASCRRRRRRSPRASAARRRAAGVRLHARSCARRPVELGRRQVAGVELVDQQHEAGIPARSSTASRSGRRCRAATGHALDAELGRAHVELVQLDPLRRESSARSGTRAAWRRCRSSG